MEFTSYLGFDKTAEGGRYVVLLAGFPEGGSG